MNKLLTETTIYDEPGSWGRMSVDWPELHDPNMDIRRFVIKHESVVPYGAYVTVGNVLRVHPDYINKLARAISGEKAVEVKPCAYCGAVEPVEWIAPAPNKEGA